MPEALRILIADDDAISRRMLARVLTDWEYAVVEASDGRDAWSVLQQPEPPRLAILDWMMPGMTGPEVCLELRKRGRVPYTYVLLLTARTETADLVVGMEAGADDYVVKPLDVQELRARLRAGRRILELESDLVAAREALRDQATRDPLTWIWNRLAILDILDRELTRAAREGHSLGLCVVDLDHFKAINDRFGHLIGDAVLREAARRLQGSIRGYDGLGRYGGEEFLVVLPGLNGADAAQIAERLRIAVGSTPVRTTAGAVDVTASVGVTALHPTSDTMVHLLIDAADRALYRAKAAGRNRVEQLVMAVAN